MAQTRQQIHKRYYAKHKVKILKKQSEVRKKNPDIVKNTRLKTRYGISLKEYENALKFQKGLCSICRNEGKLFVDHHHKTGLVRGLLCKNCNFALGFFKDDISILENAIYYLKTKVIYD